MFSDQTEGAIRVVLFSGGRGSGALAELLATDARVDLTVAINGYDDGASTGEVRRFLGDALGPSDFRKNASRLARLRGTAVPSLIEFLDARLTAEATADDLQNCIDRLSSDGERGGLADVDPAVRRALVQRLRAFQESRTNAPAIDYRDASVGNFVFAGSFLGCDRDFNAAVDDYAALLGITPESSKTSPTARTRSWSPSTPTIDCSAAKKKSSTRSAATGSRTSS